MFESKIFRIWFAGALTVWAILFGLYCSWSFLLEHWFYPAVMVLGAFVAGLTPEGGGAVAFPFLSLFFDVDRVLARDFSLMIQSVGMTSASIFILSHRGHRLAVFRPLLAMVPPAFAGFIAGMLALQALPVFLIQAAFLCLIAAFAIAYVFGRHRGRKRAIRVRGPSDVVTLGGVLFLGGLCASLFGTGADILLYTLLVTRFSLKEKLATQMSIVLMAAMSLLGFGYRHFVDAGLAADQIKTWLCAYPVVLFMAPFGVFILRRINVEWMLRGVVLLNAGQLLYFNASRPSWEKLAVSLVLFVVFLGVFSRFLPRGERLKNAPRAS